MNLVFGPVPSRRLGRSLGVNNIPDKTCTYACVYCQIGSTLKMYAQRREFYAPEEIYQSVKSRVKGANIDYITFVPDGESTLDINLGKAAKMLKYLGKVAIITNSSLIYREDVRADLLNFDYVSLKLDAITPTIWKKVNRPYKELDLDKIREGMLEFRREFKGTLVTETMLIGEIDYGDELEKLAEFIAELKPDASYIAVPTRPPAEPWVHAPDESTIARAHALFSKYARAELLIGYEGTEFSTTGNFEQDIMSITAVHPMREDAVLALLYKCDEKREKLEKMIKEGKIIKVEYNGEWYYMRALPSRKNMVRE